MIRIATRVRALLVDRIAYLPSLRAVPAQRALFVPRHGSPVVAHPDGGENLISGPASRRALLGRIAAVLALGGSIDVGEAAARSTALPAADLIPLSPVAPAPLATAPAEDPALIAIGEKIEHRVSAYRAAVEAKQAAMAACRELCPPWPEEIVRKPSDRSLFPDAYHVGALYEEARDFDDTHLPIQTYRAPDSKGIIRDFAHMPVNLLSSKLLQERIDNGRLHLDRRTMRAKTILKKLDLAKWYEDRRAAAITECQIEARCEEIYQTEGAVTELAEQAGSIPPQTVVGVMIYARILTAVDDCRSASWRGAGSSMLGGPMANAILRVMGRVA